MRDLHHRPVLYARVVCEAEYAPQDQVLILDVVIPVRNIRETVDFGFTHEGVSAGSVELVVLVLGYPQMMARKLGAL